MILIRLTRVSDKRPFVLNIDALVSFERMSDSTTRLVLNGQPDIYVIETEDEIWRRLDQHAGAAAAASPAFTRR
jgi:hypothetical protein